MLEYGTDKQGQIAKLTRLAPPDVAVVTTIAPAHLESLKTLEGVAREKMALVQAVPPSGLAILGTDHEYVSLLAQAACSPVVQVHGKGEKFARNAARVVCQHLNIPQGVVESGLNTFETIKGRLHIQDIGGMTLIDDSYNANPASMRYGLDMLSEKAAAGGRRVAILGLMAELGGLGQQYHREIGDYARSHADFLIGVGDLAKLYGADRWFEDSDVCAEQIVSLLRPRDCILVKGSGSASMRKVADKLRELDQQIVRDSPNELIV